MRNGLIAGIVVTTLLTLCADGFAQNNMSKMRRYTKVPSGYLMVLRQGDNLFEQLEAFAIAENIPSANLSGMGFVNMRFGFFDFKTKKDNPKVFNDVELASMQGTIAWKDEKPSIHAHGVVGDEKFNGHAGHILDATVSTGSLEILIIPHDKKFERKQDPSIGANVLDIDGD